MTDPLARLDGANARPAPVRIETIKKRAGFLAAARARKHAARALVLQARDRGEADAAPVARIGFTCSKKVGNAVARNRAKRRLRAAAAAIMPQGARPGWDYVLIGRRDQTATRDFSDLKADLSAALERVHAPRGQAAQ